MNNAQAIIEAQRIAVIGTLMAAFIGGLIGFFGSWLASINAARSERKRLLLQLGFEMGMKQWDNLYVHSSKLAKSGETLLIGQPSSFVHMNIRILELLADGKLTPETLSRILKENKKIVDTFN